MLFFLWEGSRNTVCLAVGLYLLNVRQGLMEGIQSQSLLGMMMNSSVHLKTSKYNVTTVKLRSRFSML